MAFERSDASANGSGAPMPVKLGVAGGFAVRKTTCVGAISEIQPLTTEAAMTEASADVDDATCPGAIIGFWIGIAQAIYFWFTYVPR